MKKKLMAVITGLCVIGVAGGIIVYTSNAEGEGKAMAAFSSEVLDVYNQNEELVIEATEPMSIDDTIRGASEGEVVSSEVTNPSGGDTGTGEEVLPATSTGIEGFTLDMIDPDLHASLDGDTVTCDDTLLTAFHTINPDYLKDGHIQVLGDSIDTTLYRQVKRYFENSITKENFYDYVLNSTITKTQTASSTTPSGGGGSGSSGGSGGSTTSVQPSGGNSSGGGTAGGGTSGGGGSTGGNTGVGGGQDEWSSGGTEFDFNFSGGGNTSASDALLDAIANGTATQSQIPGAVIQ